MWHRIISFISLFLLTFSVIFPTLAFADTADSDLLGVTYGREAGLSRLDPRIVVAQIIQVALGLLGVIALAFVVYAGFLWLTSGGNDERVTAAKNTLFRSVVGLLIIFSAYALTVFVVRQLYKATTGYTYQESSGIF